MPVTPYSPVAFRCNTCGRLHEADHAGEHWHPAACRVCGAGVRFDTRTGLKTAEPDNWEVLADATPDRLEELGLAPEDVDAHEPWPPGEVPEAHRERHFGAPPQQANPSPAGPPREPREVRVEAREESGAADRAD